LDLGPEETGHVKAIAEMLFLKDDLKIRSASYALIPFIDLDNRKSGCQALEQLQALVAYCYSAPHPIFGDTFLSYEHASLAIFSPGKVSVYVARPKHHVVQLGEHKALAADKWGFVQGYHGLYNFKHDFWVVDGSRIYPPVPDIGLNISQDLAADFGQFFPGWTHYQSLLGLIGRSASATAERILRAIMWFNDANSLASDEQHSILNLAVAFETLVGLPDGEKTTERLTDAISLLLGRLPRLDIWARQFYQARCEIAHRGRADNVEFIVGHPKRSTDVASYRPLLSYGRQAFQLCVTTLLVGAELAIRAGLEEKLVTNQERFKQVCETLSDETVPAPERLQNILSKVNAIDRYQFVGETGLSIETMLGAMKLAAKTLLASGWDLDSALRASLENINKAGRSYDNYEVLSALRDFHELTPAVVPSGNPPKTAALTLIDLVWRLTFMHYYWVKEEREKKAGKKDQSY